MRLPIQNHDAAHQPVASCPALSMSALSLALARQFPSTASANFPAHAGRCVGAETSCEHAAASSGLKRKLLCFVPLRAAAPLGRYPTLTADKSCSPAGTARAAGARVLKLPMQAGGTMVAALKEIVARGASPSNIRIISVLSSPPALKLLSEQFPGVSHPFPPSACQAARG